MAGLYSLVQESGLSLDEIRRVLTETAQTAREHEPDQAMDIA